MQGTTALSLTAPMKFIIISAMHAFSAKFLLLILSLLLVMAPLQGVFAWEMSMPPTHPDVMSGMQSHMDHAQNAMLDAADECGDCSGDSNCCTGACSMHHCTSCVTMAFLPETFSFQLPDSVDVLAEYPVGNELIFNTLPYRPPQA